MGICLFAGWEDSLVMCARWLASLVLDMWFDLDLIIVILALLVLLF